MRWILFFAIAIQCGTSSAQGCFQTSVMAPSPLMGNHGEIFRTAEGHLFEVVGSYEYLYAYYPSVTVCPDRGRMLVEGRTVGIRALQAGPAPSPGKRSRGAGQPRSGAATAPNKVVLRVRGCDYFVADGPQGYYLLEWYGGHDPSNGDGIFGELSSYGFKDVMYEGGQDGKVYIDDYMLSKDRVLEKIREKCR